MSFNDVNQKQSLPDLEKEILAFWEKEDIFKKSVKKNEGKPKYVFYDGPPFANGMPHYGHIMANALKDAVTRYWNMRGFYVPRRNGWDTHGLPVEYEVEKDQGISGRKDIVEKLGVEKFNTICRESVFKYTLEWEQMLKRMGRWVDFEDSYATLETPYMETILWIFKTIWDKGMVYQDYRSMHICPRCETPLSNFEVNQGYKDVTDPTAIAKFSSMNDNNTYFLAWTTTPWTLPGNSGLAVGPDIDYVKVRQGDQFYILAKERLESVMGEEEYEVLETMKGSDLDGMSYTPLYDEWKDTDVDLSNAYRVVTADFVSTEDGTGIVHIAPAFGEDDLQLGSKKNLPILQHVKGDGTIKTFMTKFAGKFVKDADNEVIRDLQSRNLLFKKASYTHSYPHCWRCDTPLLNYARKAWFIKVTDIKDKLLKNNKKIHWQPEHLQEGRFGKWLDGVRDWNVSRNRFWGCPIPIWECDNCEKQICIGSIDELKELSGGQVPMRDNEVDLHRPYIDEITFDCKCGGTMKRVPEVLDCWFESGSMPYAQDHYPFDNKKDFEKNFPAEFIAEGLDQTRGWFYTLHVLATILFDKPAFTNVIVNGILLAENGEKLSKRLKNYPDPVKLFETTGVDSLRYFLYSSTASLAEDVRFSERLVNEVVKRFTLTLWNTYSFFVTYANLDNWEPKEHPATSTNALDVWILSELQLLNEEVTQAIEDYNLCAATRPFETFVDNLSNWYVRRSRRRFWKSENDGDKDDAYQTLYTVLVTLSKLLAPFMPFLADAMYRNLTETTSPHASVHLEDWPEVNKKEIHSSLHTQIEAVRLVVNLGHAIRARNTIKVRQPLAKMRIGVPQGFDVSLLEEYKEVILEELNIKELEILTESTQIAKHVIKPNAKVLGPKYGADVQIIIRKAKEGEFEIMEDGSAVVGDVTLEANEFEVGFEGANANDIASEKGFVVNLDTEITEDLRLEGLMRDLIRLIQDQRKQDDLQVSDRINLTITSDHPDLEQMIKLFKNYISTETLAQDITVVSEKPKTGDHTLDNYGLSLQIEV